MPAQPPSPAPQNDHTLLNSSPSNHRQPANEPVTEEVVKVMELPVASSSASETVAEVDKQRLQHVAAAVKEDSDSSHADEEELPEFVYIDLQVIRKDVQCPICLGIIRKTRTVMECLHRFCRECIDKSMRMGNNECPACRTHCASRRSLRDDSRYDAFIAALFPDIEQYEAEELAFCEEERSRNKQIQASIAQISKRQSEALGKKKCSRKGTGSQRNVRETPSRRSKRKRSGKTEFESEDDEDLENIEGQTSSSSGDQCKEDQDRQICRRRILSTHSFSPATSSGGLCIENRLEHKRSYPGIMWNIEMRTWGRNGVRSGHVRKNPQSTHLAKFEFLQKFVKKDCQNASFLTACNDADKQLLAAKEPPQAQGNNKRDTLHLSPSIDGDKGRLSDVVNQFRDMLQLSEEKILPGFEANTISHGGLNWYSRMPAEGNYMDYGL